MGSKDHWERVYATKATDRVSWYQPHAEHSLRLIHETGLPRSASIIDVGGGASTLVDDLLHDGYAALTVLDLSAAALAAARERLGSRGNAGPPQVSSPPSGGGLGAARPWGRPEASQVRWLEGNVLELPLPAQGFDLWHDRAVFHFLTSPEDRQAYVQAVLRAVKPGGHVIVATFAEDGPTQCSGLPVMRYSAGELHAAFGAPFTLIKHEKEAHQTPMGTVQQFVYCLCRTAAN